MNLFAEMLEILAADRSLVSLAIIADELECRGYEKESRRIRPNPVRTDISDEYFLTKCEGWLRILSEDLETYEAE